MAGSTADEGREADRLIYVGLLGISAASVIQLVEKESLDIPLMIAAYGFAVATPLLTIGLIADYARRAGRRIAISHDIMGIFGVLAGATGFGAVFFHFGIIIGITFTVFAFLGIFVIRHL